VRTAENLRQPDHQNKKTGVHAMSTTFDSERYKVSTREQWQAAADAWNGWGSFLRQWLGPATGVMLDMAGVGEGARVLDVAAGAGDQSLQAAARVGKSGHVLATDISPKLLAHCEANSQAGGLTNVSTMIAFGEELLVEEAAFDAVISRVGLIYFPDQQKALAAMRRALRLDGWIGAIVYASAEENPFFSIPVSIIRRRASLPPPLPGMPGPFSLGSPGVIEAAFQQAGLRNVSTRKMSANLTMPSAAECVRFERESFGALHQMLAGLDEVGQAAAWEEAEEALGKFEGPSGFSGVCTLVIAAGQK
jgi:ubiquinone/menaquinone biosynthesis C-methylase UbiE